MVRRKRMGRVIKTKKGYGILAEFQAGGTGGAWVQRVLVKDTSKKKATELLKKWKTGEIYGKKK